MLGYRIDGFGKKQKSLVSIGLGLSSDKFIKNLKKSVRNSVFVDDGSATKRKEKKKKAVM